MFSVQQILTLFLTLTMELGLTACGAEAVVQPAPETSEPPAQVQETPEATPDTPPESSELELKVTGGTESYRDFQMNNVLHAPEGEIHYHSSRRGETASQRRASSVWGRPSAPVRIG